MKQFSIFLIIALFNSISGITYDLDNYIEKEILSLEEKKDYYFKLHTLDFDFKIFNISSATNFTGSAPFKYLYFYEYSSETSIYHLSTYRIIDLSFKNKEYISSLSYSIDSDTKLISLKINPLYNIDYIRIKVTLLRNKFYLSNGVDEEIKNLKSGNLYYFFISCHLFQRAIISLNIISSYLDIYEYSDKYSSKYIKKTSLDIPSTNSLNYQVSDNITQDIAVMIARLYYRFYEN